MFKSLKNKLKSGGSSKSSEGSNDKTTSADGSKTKLTSEDLRLISSMQYGPIVEEQHILGYLYDQHEKEKRQMKGSEGNKQH
ncbi:hypothetical protein BGZ65_006541 [Modicella reniformis]|uniref:Uncharacterized protein n=1 Tax=Modicella reniformis TaxID=1440133 RepID=A0A9P6SSL7_9FUNG|nr:hypothetical protein BGZ65_006541 [Modicella reniformis]